MERPARARGSEVRAPSAGAGGASAAAYAAAICGIALAAAVFLPWYATNLGAPFTTGAASGWEWTGLARIASPWRRSPPARRRRSCCATAAP